MNIINSSDQFDLIPQYLANDGYVVLKQIFSTQELLELYDLYNSDIFLKFSQSMSSYALPNAAHIFRELDSIVCHPKLHHALSYAFNHNPYAFTSHSDLHLNTVAGWHKDDGKGSYFPNNVDYFSSNLCKVYKIGIYLQDASTLGGLTVKKGSHNSGYSFFGLNYDSNHEEIYLPSILGDIVLFDVRITHKGHSNSKTNFYYRLLKRLSLVNDIKLNYQRRSFFFTFGLSNDFTHDFALTNMSRQVSQLNSTSFTSVPTELSNLLSSLKVDYFSDFLS